MAIAEDTKLKRPSRASALRPVIVKIEELTGHSFPELLLPDS
mgnify:CR=1 FL=1